MTNDAKPKADANIVRIADAIQTIASAIEDAGCGLSFTADEKKHIAGGMCELARYLCEDHLGKAISQAFVHDECGDEVNVTDCLLRVAEELGSVAEAGRMIASAIAGLKAKTS